MRLVNVSQRQPCYVINIERGESNTNFQALRFAMISQHSGDKEVVLQIAYE